MTNLSVGSKDEYIEASLVAAQEPWTCTPRQFKILESSHPAVAREARRKAAQHAQQKADEAQRRVEARPAATGPLVAPPPAPDEDVKAWWQRHRGAAASVGLVKSVFDIIADFAKRLKAKNDGRDIQFTALEARVSALEQRPQLKDAGVWTSGQSYTCARHREPCRERLDLQRGAYCRRRYQSRGVPLARETRSRRTGRRP